ncbi:DUF1801 domain-containing protein [Planctomicrobium sp. SH664]|uniref:DUF1801 domain-containing protein n=1 Tax=Planctomicrobium sp. SH664 TaxID=3448125 RepID=UPI003F5BB5D3
MADGPSKRTKSPPKRKSGTAAVPPLASTAPSPSQRIDQRIQELNDWRGETLAEVRQLILKADPEMTEEWKWKGIPVWSHAGNVCTGETYKQVVKLTFVRGASLPDPHQLFNSSLEGNTRRAIDLREGERIGKKAFQELIRAAVAENLKHKSARGRQASSPAKSKSRARPAFTQNAEGVVLLSGGNPQIAKGDGEAPVREYIAALSGWKQDLAQRLDHLITQAIPGVQKGVRWNSPFYGVEGQGWCTAFHVFTKYLKVTFFYGMSLHPLPPGPSKDKNARYLDIRESDVLDEAQFLDWVRQAAAIPGWKP